MSTAQHPDPSDSESVKLAQLRLQRVLNELLGTSLDDPLTQAVDRLPEELGRDARVLLKAFEAWRIVPERTRLGALLFDAGVLHEKIRAQHQAQMEIESAIIELDGVKTSSLETTESERISRFITVRDRLFRQVADFTLKALLVILGLLVLGLLIGII